MIRLLIDLIVNRLPDLKYRSLTIFASTLLYTNGGHPATKTRVKSLIIFSSFIDFN